MDAAQALGASDVFLIEGHQVYSYKDVGVVGSSMNYRYDDNFIMSSSAHVGPNMFNRYYKLLQAKPDINVTASCLYLNLQYDLVFEHNDVYRRITEDQWGKAGEIACT